MTQLLTLRTVHRVLSTPSEARTAIEQAYFESLSKAFGDDLHKVALYAKLSTKWPAMDIDTPVVKI